VVLDVVLEESESFGGLTVVLDDQGRAASDLSGNTSLVVLALTNPFAELLSGVNVNEGNLVLLGKSRDELLVLGIIAVISEDAKVSILSVKGLANLVESLNEAYTESEEFLRYHGSPLPNHSDDSVHRSFA